MTRLILIPMWAGFLALGTDLSAAEALTLDFSGSVAKDLAMARPVKLENTAVTQSGKIFCADLDGKGAIVIGSDSGLDFGAGDTFWLTALVNPRQFGQSVPIVTKGANYRIAVQSDGKVLFTYYSAGAWRSIVANSPLQPNTWQRIACYLNSPMHLAALLVDGKVAAISSSADSFQSTSDVPLYIGGNPVGDIGTFRGFVGYIGSVTLAREAPYTISPALQVGTKVFDVAPLN